MLKKLNANITKLLFYIKNNLVSCVFKLSILSTMLILVYLVCILSQTDNVSSSDNNGVYSIENSQRLMLTIPTEIPADTFTDFDSSHSTTESLDTINENSIQKNNNIYMGTHPLFKIEESTTNPMSAIGQIKPETEKQPKEKTDTNPVPGCTAEEEEEYDILTSTEETITQDMDHINYAHKSTSTEAIRSILPDSALPIKRSISIDALEMHQTTSIETTTNSQTVMFTTTNNPEEMTELTIQHLDISSTTPEITTLPPIFKNDLFMENWASHISAENQDLDLNDDSSLDMNFLKEPTKSLFENEDSKFASIETPIFKNESNESSSSTIEQQVNSNIENTSHQQYSETQEYHPFFSPKNLLNLFALDQQPSSSNLKTTWWPKSKSSTMSDLEESAAKNHIKRSNKISPNDDSQEMGDGAHLVFRQGFDNLLNRKLKKSVSMLEKLFGNYFLQ